MMISIGESEFQGYQVQVCFASHYFLLGKVEVVLPAVMQAVLGKGMLRVSDCASYEVMTLNQNECEF